MKLMNNLKKSLKLKRVTKDIERLAELFGHAHLIREGANLLKEKRQLEEGTI